MPPDHEVSRLQAVTMPPDHEVSRLQAVTMPPDHEVSHLQAVTMPPDHEVSHLQAVTVPPTCCGGSISGSLQLRPTNENNVTRETPQPNIQQVAVGAGIGTNEREGRRQNAGSANSKYYLSPALRATFARVGATAKTYTFQEILGLLKAYLYANRHLFDPADILFVNCANDPLGHVFKIERFHYTDVRSLIARHIIPERRRLAESFGNLLPSGSCDNCKGQSCDLSNERTSCDCNGVDPSFYANGKTCSSVTLVSTGSTECEDLGTVTESGLPTAGTEKQGTGTAYGVPGSSKQSAEEFSCSSRWCHQTSSLTSITLQFPVPAIPESNSEAESEYSFQGYETAFCRNTEFEDSDESSESEFVEYEIASDNDMQELALSDDDSVIEDVEVAVLAIQTIYEDDLEEAFWADDSDQSTDEDKELLKDKWDCVTCGIKNMPFVRYCEKCWQLRKNWLPERPKKKRKPRPKKKLRRRTVSTDLEESSSEKPDSGQESSEILRSLSTATTVSLPSSEQDLQCEQLSSQDSGISLSQESSTQSLQDLVMEVPANTPSGSKDSSKSSTNLQPKTSQKNSEASGELSSHETTSIKRKTYSEAESLSKKCKSSEVKELPPKGEFLDKNNKNKEDTVLPDVCESKMDKFHRFLKSEEGFKWTQSISTKELIKAFEASGSDNTEEKQMCVICCIRPKNAIITHGRLSHQATCYQCARRLLDSGARCPVCRRKIHMVHKNIIV